MTPAALSALAKGDIKNAVVASTPGGIEAQEEAGQRMLVAKGNDLLPIKGTSTREERAVYEKMGFVFHQNHDDIVVCATFPLGWTKEATGHSMWSRLIDDKGRERASIFYKAAFYDRGAHISLKRRYSVNSYHRVESGSDSCSVVVNDGDKIIMDFGQVDASGDARPKLREDAIAWLNKNFPQWQDETAYWD